MKELTIDSLPVFNNPDNITPAEVDYATEVIRTLNYDIYDEFAIQLEMTQQHLFNFIINLNRQHLNELMQEENSSKDEKMVIDRVYQFDILSDITGAEIEYAEKVLSKLNHDLLKITPDNVLLSHDSIINQIVQIKRINDSLGL
jgi:protein-tyrosine-phosphatase